MYRRKRLATGTVASFLIVALVGLVVLSSGTAYATAMATASGSGFTVTADEIRSDDFLLYPSIGEDTEGTTPVAVVEQRGVEIDGMVLSGEKSIPMIDGSMEISFAADGTVKADEQYIKLTDLKAEEATFNGQVVNAQATDNPEQQFQQTAGGNADPEDGYLTDISGEQPGMVQEDVEMEAVYLASNEISLPGLDVDVEYHPDG
ncbi:hypothetical protein C488_03881 [Natrinema pellirubrum DSM 15624]|uniref:Uncharacterized protein n=1 Tax=Natrinema pellirubrum (strain DSM 15624 / CIP 106293 / JCM 10476 / NCIMB 786 / 157) TaxID=797303 RepID=L0JIP7_NATP1|nr:DUF6230 family protein [Natrinema pellirubrum]AGB30718.1 hypothetical protein Natpe_0799 [Natrinema pellirubrum DSM 15624]ELY80412.1 hypothetical protein C488_03881 [Natrinema pellirubrum DSM 15624]